MEVHGGNSAVTIIKSKYTREDVKGFEHRELDRVGYDAMEYAKSTDNAVLMASIGTLLLSVAVVCAGCIASAWMYKNGCEILIAFIITAMSAVMCAALYIGAILLARRGETGLYRLTENKMKRQEFKISHSQSPRFKHYKENHDKLWDLYEFLDAHPEARIEYNRGMQRFEILCNEGLYRKEREIDITKSLIDKVMKENSIDCSCCDWYFDKIAVKE